MKGLAGKGYAILAGACGNRTLLLELYYNGRETIRSYQAEIRQWNADDHAAEDIR